MPDDSLLRKDYNHKEFKHLVKEAIADELSAVAMYVQMANMVKNPVLRAIIFSIAGDEYNHARTWMTILEQES
ncbi:MAG: ferritin-like domain-containing protein [Firmicutes bacterium]|jgi:rubrerythrin|nr:ferritin-like domain-containing protein [Bacillota bacterium]